MFSDMVVGTDTMAKLSNGNNVHCINFDNAATTPPLKSVMKSLEDFSPYYSSIHRGAGYKSKISSNIYEDGRTKVLEFVNGTKDYHTVIFLKNTTECINKLSHRLQCCLKDKIVLTTYMEHHSNMLPWRERYKTDYIEVDKAGRLCLEDLEFKLRIYGGKVGLVCVSGASNVTGYVNPVHKIARMCHKYGAKILVDGAQAVPHIPFDMKPVGSPEQIDFLAFSAHKMYAPFGIGALIGPREIFMDGCSEMVGGGTVKFVSSEDIIWEDPPEKEEAGTPNVMGVVALIESINTMQEVGMKHIEEYERGLTSYALSEMKDIPHLVLYDDLDVKNKVSIISFNMNGIHHMRLADMLSDEGGISVRSGCFCAQPYVQRLLRISKENVKKFMYCYKSRQPGLVRISFGFYNDKNEIDLLIYLLNKISKNISYC